jgi:hypothetical protein
MRAPKTKPLTVYRAPDAVVAKPSTQRAAHDSNRTDFTIMMPPERQFPVRGSAASFAEPDNRPDQSKNSALAPIVQFLRHTAGKSSGAVAPDSVCSAKIAQWW